MTRFLVTYHGSEMPHEPEAMAQARDALIRWAGTTGPPSSKLAIRSGRSGRSIGTGRVREQPKDPSTGGLSLKAITPTRLSRSWRSIRSSTAADSSR